MRFLLCLFLSGYGVVSFSQKKISKKDIAKWEKAIVNIETEGLIRPKFVGDSLYQVKKEEGYSAFQLDSLSKVNSYTSIATGTAIYIKYKDRKYLITARHVIFDEVLAAQKKYENRQEINKWSDADAIKFRISVRTPFKFYKAKKEVNNFAVYNNNFTEGIKPFFFISDSTGDGIGVISLQDMGYKSLDTLLQRNGCIPVQIEHALPKRPIEVLDEIYTIGYPELVSVIYTINFQKNIARGQLPDIVNPFVVRGTIAMYDPRIQHYYSDLTITPGNSGGPVINRGKLIGIVSGVNKYRIINEGNNGQANNTLYGLGHLVTIINLNALLPQLEKYRVILF